MREVPPSTDDLAAKFSLGKSELWKLITYALYASRILVRGASGVLTRGGGGAVPKIGFFPLKLPAHCMILKKILGTRMGPGPQGPLDPLVRSNIPSQTLVTPTEVRQGKLTAMFVRCE